ncbi:MAG: lytic transglycosylase domain-containing protein [Alphaproteobacteria bacterium]|nr:lytic transglycosylase domain-containing protein [Alphaproteobacteria bacterium]
MYRTPYFLVVVLLIISFGVCSSAHASWNISRKDMDCAKLALDAGDNGQWTSARSYAAQCQDITIRKIVSWRYFTTTNVPVIFQEIKSFIENNPNFPRKNILLRHAEEAMGNQLSEAEILEWFEKYPPITAIGKRRYGEKLYNQKNQDPALKQRAIDLLKDAWMEGDFGPIEEDTFLNNYGNLFTAKEHVKRADNLLWAQKVTQAKRMIPKVPYDYQKLFRVRIELLTKRHGGDSLINSVPTRLRNDPGLLFDRIQWRDKRNNPQGVISLLRSAPKNLPHPEKWWNIASDHIRTMIKYQKFQEAYDIAQNHDLVEGTVFAEREWLAGWIALRFLHNPALAYRHFFKLYHGVETTSSLARGAYWSGRAAKENGNNDISVQWFKTASAYITSFYGQLALSELGTNEGFLLPEKPKVEKSDISLYQRNELAKAANILTSIGEVELSRTFLQAAIVQAKTPGEMVLISKAGMDFNRANLSLFTGKEALNLGVLIPDYTYPIITDLKLPPAGNALIHSIIRQESMFEQNSRSTAGATGMMQIMPDTAKHLAKKLNVAYDPYRLYHDYHYNLTLGHAFVKDLMSRYKQSYVLAIASYNAGPGNVDQWINIYGDPRKALSIYDVIDWVELIPFKETRNYVQRVMENLPVYHYRLKQPVMITDLLWTSNSSSMPPPPKGNASYNATATDLAPL